MAKKRKPESTLTQFFKMLKTRIEPSEVGDALRRGAVEEIKSLRYRPGMPFLLTVINSLYESARATAEAETSQDSAAIFSKLCRELDQIAPPEIALALKEIGIDHEPTRLVLASILKTMGRTKAFEKPQPPDLQEILTLVLTERQTSFWRHNQLMTAFDRLRRDAAFESQHFQTAMGKQSVVAKAEHARILQEARALNDFARTLPDLWKAALKQYRVEEDEETQVAIEAQYLEKVTERYGHLRVLGIDGGRKDALKIDTAFVSLAIERRDGRRDSGSETFSVEQALNTHDKALIVGAPGSGKSSLLQWEAVQCSTRPMLPGGEPNRRFGMIPFFLPCRSFKGIAFPEIQDWVGISAPITGYETSDIEKWVNSVLDNGRAIVIVDGLDEMSDDLRPAFWTRFHETIGSHPLSVFRLSARPSIEDVADNGRAPWTELDPIHRFVVQPLTLGKIDELIDRWHKALVDSHAHPDDRRKVGREIHGYPERLKGKLRRHDFRDILGLVDTPLLCAALCVINRRTEEAVTNKKRDFYLEICRALLHKRDADRPLIQKDKRYDALGFEEAFGLHAFVAYKMISAPEYGTKGKPYLIEASKAEVCDWLGECHADVIRNREILNVFDSESMLDYLLVRRCLMREPSEGRIDFNHRHLQEYLAASYMLSPNKRGEPKELKQLVSRADEGLWRDTIRLAGGGKDRSDADCLKLFWTLKERGEADPPSRNASMLAIANLAHLDAKQANLTEDVLELIRVAELTPPRTLDEAQDLAAAGDPIIPILEPLLERKENPEERRLTILTLLYLGTPEAFTALNGAFANDPAELIDCLRDTPNINALELPCVLDCVRTTGEIPFVARPYVYDLTPIEALLSLSSLNLRHCANLSDLEPLAKLTSLRRVDLSYCPTHLDVAPLKELASLEVLEWVDRPEAEILSPTVPPADPKPGDVYYHPIAGFSASPTSSLLHIPMVWVDGGTFRRGEKDPSDKKPYEVTLSGFWMAKYATTQAQWEAVMGENPSHFKGANNPVGQVSWDEAVKFCETLSQGISSLQSPASCLRFALPTEAQWEYACRAGSEAAYCFGDSEDELDDFAWYDKNSENTSHPVGMKKPNDWGLYDLHGNVWEWCRDWYGDYPGGAVVDPSGPATGASRVCRGGSWGNLPGFLRSASRLWSSPDGRYVGLGFRVVVGSRP